MSVSAWRLAGIGFLSCYSVTRHWLLAPVFLVGALLMSGLTGLLPFLQASTLSLLKLAIWFALLWLIFRDVLSTGERIAMQFISVAIFAPLQELGNVIAAYGGRVVAAEH